MYLCESKASSDRGDALLLHKLAKFSLSTVNCQLSTIYKVPKPFFFFLALIAAAPG